LRKFNILFIFLLTIFLVVGVVAIFIQDTDPFSDTTLPEVESMTKVPGYSTMMTVATIVEDELSEDAILDLVVSPSGNEEHVTLKLLSNDLLTEENLLKESYPILLQTSTIEDVTSFTISWHLDNDLPIMSFTLDKSGLSNMMLENYATIPSIAQNYYKHESMN